MKNQNHWALAIISSALFGILTIGVFSYSLGSASLFISATMISCASAACGILLGFLFGIPRSGYETSPPQTNENNNSTNENNTNHYVVYKANTNLEQISDWLTKILVGVGLTQLPNLSNDVFSFGEYISKHVGIKELNTILIISICIYYTILGFFASYLWTRLHLGGQLAKADLDLFTEKFNQITKQTEEITHQSSRIEKDIVEREKIDARALSLTNKFLSPNAEEAIDITELKHVIERASPPIRVHIFYRTRQFRSECNSNAKQAKFVEKTIPIFEALIESEKDQPHHQNHGQLGLALEAKPGATDADFERAAIELSKAIALRGPADDKGYQIYELTRAICRIRIDPQYLNGSKSNPDHFLEIANDLKIASSAFHDFEENDIVLCWLSKNDISDINSIEN